MRRRDRAEWITFAVSCALIALVVGAIGAMWIAGPEGPAAPRVERAGAITASDGVFRIPYAVVNDGGRTAADVQVTATLEVGGRVEEEGEQRVMFLSGGERETGAFLFRADPATGVLTLAVVSFSDP